MSMPGTIIMLLRPRMTQTFSFFSPVISSNRFGASTGRRFISRMSASKTTLEYDTLLSKNTGDWAGHLANFNFKTGSGECGRHIANCNIRRKAIHLTYLRHSKMSETLVQITILGCISPFTPREVSNLSIWVIIFILSV